jgi:hypothetical protein
MSLYIEAVAIVPQLLMLQVCGGFFKADLGGFMIKMMGFYDKMMGFCYKMMGFCYKNDVFYDKMVDLL